MLAQMFEIGGLVDVNFTAVEWASNDRAQCRVDEHTGSLVALQSTQLRKERPRENGGSAACALIGRRGDCRSSMRMMGSDERAEMLGGEPRLVTGDEQSAGGLRSAQVELAKASANGRGDALLPVAVEDGNGILKIDLCAD